MADAYDAHPEDLARFYAERLRAGYGPAAMKKVGWNIRDAITMGDRRRGAFWEKVRAALERHSRVED